MNILEENDSFVFWEEEGIFCSRFKKSTVDLEMAKKSVAARLRLTNSQPCKLFMDIRNLKYVSQSAREFSASIESTQFAEACAILAPSMITKLIANFFMSFNKPNLPTQIFTNKEKAFEWLGSTGVR
jgi:hypothetical protein